MKGLAIYYADQCDKKKCTSVRIYANRSKLSFPLYWITNKKKIRKKSLILSPSGSLLLPSDRNIVDKYGMTVLDCSWKKNDPILDENFQNKRCLPKLLAGNPVNYGKWDFLSSMEAVSASLYILGYTKLTSEILDILTWGKSFFDLNKELLDAYSEVTSDSDYKQIWEDFFP
ncbi:MAG: DUF367 family protein [Candidatus Thorarchaeota archaeon]